MEQYGYSISAGASEISDKPSQLNSAYMHAGISVKPIAGEQMPQFVPGAETAVIYKPTFKVLQRINGLLLSGEIDLVHAELDALFDELSQAQPGSIVYKTYATVCYVLETIANVFSAHIAFLSDESERETPDILLQRLHMYVDQTAQIIKDNENNQSDFAIHRILEFIEKNYMNPALCVEMISDNFGISRTYLFNAMKKATKCSFSDYLEGIRMKHAKALLEDTTLSVSEVAAACGYNTSNTFSKAYKRNFYVSPKAKGK
jgi:AraC-like DNA-binding protein